MRQKLLTLVSILGLALSSVLSGLFVMRPALVRAYTSPGSPTGFVNDFAGVLSEDDERTIDEDLAQFRSDTSNELVVATIDTIDGDTIENYANRLFREWGIGDSEKNNGVLLLIVTGDRLVRIEVGYGLEGAITDLESGRIIDGVLVPRFREGDYAGGIIEAATALKEAAQGEYNTPYQQPVTNKFRASDFLFFGVFVLTWVGSFLARSKSWWAGGVVGAVIAAVFWLLNDVLVIKIAATVLAPTLGLLFDYVVSRNYQANIARGGNGGFFSTRGGFGGGGSGGGFGGFSGGSSGGGGSSGSW